MEKNATTVKQILFSDEKVWTHAEATEKAAKLGGELPSLREFIFWLKDPKNYELAIERCSCNWLRDDRSIEERVAALERKDKAGIGATGYRRINFERGTLEMVSDEEYEALPPEERAWAYYGTGANILLIIGDFYGCRLTTIAPSKIHQAANLSYVLRREATGSAQINDVGLRLD